MNLRRLRAITRKEFLHILRDPLSLGMALALPFMMLLLFGWALSLDVDKIPVYVWDQDRSPESRALIEDFRGSRYFQIMGVSESYQPIDYAINQGRALVGLVVPRGYSSELLSGGTAPVQVLLDGSDSNTASIAMGYAQALLQTRAGQIRADAIMRKGGAKPPAQIDTRIRVIYNSDLKSKNYIVPGLIAVILMIIAALLTSLTIAREWENGTMEQLLSTPLRPTELVLGKLLAYFAVGIFDMLVCVLVAVYVFDVPLRGSILYLFASSSLFLFGALSTGILISASTRSQLQAYQLGVLTSFLPAFLLSGFIYSVENMPKVIQALCYMVPARYFVSIVKGVFLKGVGPLTLWFETLLLAVYALAVFVLASRKMRQKLA